MTSTDTTTTTADASVTPITKTRRPSRTSRAAAQSAKPASAAKRMSARSSSSKPASTSKPARKLDADAAAARAKLLDERTKSASDVPAGYVIHWAYPAGHSRLSRTSDAPADAPKWLARCDAHGTTTPASDAKSARALGARARRAEWCKPCAKAAAKHERDAAKAESGKAQRAASASDDSPTS
jgi:hypothetical protein